MAERIKNETGKTLVSRRDFLIGSGAVIGAVFLSACNPKTVVSTTVTPPNPSSPVTDSSSTALTPVYGGTLRSVGSPIPSNIGWPAEMVGSSSGTLIQVCLDTLLRGDNKGNIYPGLAERYTLADDRSSITFYLRKGVKFHDGSIFNADVAKWNLENYEKANAQPNWGAVDIIDEYTIRVNFNQWMITLPSSFGDCANQAYMVSKEAFDTNGIEYMRSHPIGTGPFKFADFKLDASLNFVRNPDYWVKDRPYLDAVNNIMVADATTQKMLMQAGEGDITAAAGKNALDYKNVGLNVVIGMNMTSVLIPDSANADSPWSNIKVRQAVEYAIDKEALAKAFGYGYFITPYQIPPRDCVAYNPDFKLGRSYDLEKAKALMAETPYAGGLETTIISFPAPGSENILVAIQSDLAKIGITIKLEFPDMGKFVSYMGPGTWHNAALSSAVPMIDVYFAQGLQFIFDSIGRGWSRTDELKQAYQAALTSPEPDIAKIRAVTDIMTRDALFIPVMEAGGGEAMQSNIHVNYNRGTSNMWDVENAWIGK